MTAGCRITITFPKNNNNSAADDVSSARSYNAESGHPSATTDNPDTASATTNRTGCRKRIKTFCEAEYGKVKVDDCLFPMIDYMDKVMEFGYIVVIVYDLF